MTMTMMKTPLLHRLTRHRPPHLRQQRRRRRSIHDDRFRTQVEVLGPAIPDAPLLEQLFQIRQPALEVVDVVARDLALGDRVEADAFELGFFARRAGR